MARQVISEYAPVVFARLAAILVSPFVLSILADPSSGEARTELTRHQSVAILLGRGQRNTKDVQR